MPHRCTTESMTRLRDQNAYHPSSHTTYTVCSSGLVRGCLSPILTDSTFSGRSQRGKDALEQVKYLLCKILEENIIDCYDEFSQKLMDALEWIYASASSTCTGKIMLREQLWRQFHAIRILELCEIWTTFLTTLKSNLGPLVQQYINQELFSGIIPAVVLTPLYL